MKSFLNIFCGGVLLASSILFLGACKDDDENDTQQNGITQIVSNQEQEVAASGKTVNVEFKAASKWIPSLEYQGEEGWASVNSIKGNEGAGDGSLKVIVERNATGKERTVSLLVSVDGYSAPVTVCKITQKGAGASVSETDIYLNKYMDKILKENYLFKDEYNTLTVDYENTLYTDFLLKNLSKMETNIEDGGIYREYSPSAGERYIYSYIERADGSTARANTRSTQVNGLGLGTFFVSYMDTENTKIGLAIGYVYEESPAGKAGLRRGDVITAINGTTLGKSNYRALMSDLFYATSGTYQVRYARYIRNDEAKRYDLVYDQVSMTAGAYYNNPLLYTMIIKENEENPSYIIGYLVYQSFDVTYEEELKEIIRKLKNEYHITELILDLRHNGGGTVALSQFLSGSIAGAAHGNDVYANLEFSYRDKESHKFNGNGAVDLGLNRVYIIASEETASASEIVINSLRGIDFPVRLIGAKTEGKNVGMEVKSLTYEGKVYEFAPITFRVSNAKGEGDYAEGIDPDAGFLMNNQNDSYDDDIDNLFPYAFGDWDNFDFNLPLWYALCDIRGINPTTGQPLNTRSGKPERLGRPDINVHRLPSAPLERRPGQFGALIYDSPAEVK